MPITITPTTVINEASNNYANSRLSFSLPGGFYQYTMGNTYPSSHGLQVKFPTFDQEANYSQLSNWKFRVTILQDGAVDWVKTGGVLSLEQSLGTAQNNVYTKNLVFSFYYLNQLLPGQYNKTVSISIIATNSLGWEVVVAQRSYPFSVVVTATPESFFYATYFESDVNGLAFSYGIDGPGFPTQSIFVYHNVPFTTELSNSSLLTAFKFTYSGYSRIDIVFANSPEQPSVGVLNETLTIHPTNPDLEDIIIPISINVQLTGNAPFLVVSPAVINFTIVKGAPLPIPVPVSVLSSFEWTIQNNLPAWLHLNQVSGTLSDTLVAKVTDEDLEVGEYHTRLEFRNEFNSVDIPVNLTVVDFLTSPFYSGSQNNQYPLYFTQDLDYLNFYSPEQDTYVKLELSIKMFKVKTYEPVVYSRTYDVAMFKEVGVFHLGTAVHQLFEDLESLDQVISEFQLNHYSTQYRPAEIFVSCGLRYLEDNSVIRTAIIPKIYMIKGHSPYMSGRFGLLNLVQQEVSRITPNSILNCNFCSLWSPEITIRKNGVAFEDVIIVNQDLNGKILYSYYRFNNDLVPGDVIEIVIHRGVTNPTRTRRFMVFPPGKESTHFLFENEFGLIEAFEFTGRRKINSGYTHTTQAKYSELYERNEKVKSKNNQKLSVNTGFLLPGDHKVVDAIIKSSKVWCAFDDAAGEYFKVDAVSDKIINTDSDITAVSFDVEFNILENADVTIYKQ
ncbi:hypothetical protein [Flavobacterium beibuense]|uniref:hypothetical protein n=1 Tax=Flavobacterium beibuense TaxID=657326 RepID=UPI003A90A0CB